MQEQTNKPNKLKNGPFNLFANVIELLTAIDSRI